MKNRVQKKQAGSKESSKTALLCVLPLPHVCTSTTDHSASLLLSNFAAASQPTLFTHPPSSSNKISVREFVLGDKILYFGTSFSSTYFQNIKYTPLGVRGVQWAGGAETLSLSWHRLQTWLPGCRKQTFLIFKSSLFVSDGTERRPRQSHSRGGPSRSWGGCPPPPQLQISL